MNNKFNLRDEVYFYNAFNDAVHGVITEINFDTCDEYYTFVGNGICRRENEERYTYQIEDLHSNMVYEDVPENCIWYKEEYKSMNVSMYSLAQYPAMQIEKVYFGNPKENPVTVVYWKDGTTTYVKCCEGDEFNKEVGLALCFVKKYCGNDPTKFHDFMKRWCHD